MEVIELHRDLFYASMICIYIYVYIWRVLTHTSLLKPSSSLRTFKLNCLNRYAESHGRWVLAEVLDRYFLCDAWHPDQIKHLNSRSDLLKYVCLDYISLTMISSAHGYLVTLYLISSFYCQRRGGLKHATWKIHFSVPSSFFLLSPVNVVTLWLQEGTHKLWN